MSGGTHSQGVFSKLLIEPGTSPHTFDANSERYEFLRENLRMHERIVGGGEMTGSRSRRHERTRLGVPYIYGSILKWISPAELDTLLIHMLGNNQSPTDQFNLTESLPYCGILLDRDEGVFQYNDNKVTRWILRGTAPELNDQSAPELVTLELFVIGSQEVGPNDSGAPSWPGSEPSLGTSAAYAPYVLSDTDSAVTIKGSARAITEFVLVCDHRCYARYVNSLVPHSIIERDRIIRARFRLPWNSTYSSLYATDLAGAAASVVLTNGAFSTTWTFDRLQIARNTPAADRGREEIGLILDGQVTDRSLDSNELLVLNDATA